MKKYVCDFCASVSLAYKVGKRTFKETFKAAREVSLYSKAILPSYMTTADVKVVKDVRALAIDNYKEEVAKEIADIVGATGSVR